MKRLLYKDGDKVRVRPDLVSDDNVWYCMLDGSGDYECATEEMLEFRGQEVTIRLNNGWYFYSLYEQEEDDNWSDEMFIDVNRR